MKQMKTFELKFAKFGPIKDATFTASEFSVLCGKNNTGKSFCMHAFFCFLSMWRKKIRQVVKQEHLAQIVENKKIEISVGDYVYELNKWIQDALPAFREALPVLLKKDSLKGKDYYFDVRINDEYARSVLTQAGYTITVGINAECKMIGDTKSGDDKIEIRVDSKGELFPKESEIVEAFNSTIWYLFVHRILPRPVLLTAERSGSVLYGDDVRNYSFSLVQAISGESVGDEDSILENAPAKYAYPYAEELRGIWDNKSHPPAVKPDGAINVLLETFSRVVDGEYIEKDGNVFYRQRDTDLKLLVDEVSTSVRAMTQLNYFIKRIRGINPMLMIDEPELNLHPERQRALARLLAKLVNVGGTSVMITTHSDYIVRELNSLIAFGGDGKRLSQVALDMGYEKNEFISPTDIACGVVEDGRIDQVDFQRGETFVVPSFDDTISKIDKVQMAIRNVLCD